MEPTLLLAAALSTNAWQAPLDPETAAGAQLRPTLELTVSSDQVSFTGSASANAYGVFADEEHSQLNRIEDGALHTALVLFPEARLGLDLQLDGGMHDELAPSGLLLDPTLRRGATLPYDSRAWLGGELSGSRRWSDTTATLTGRVRADDWRIPDSIRDNGFRPINQRTLPGVELSVARTGPLGVVGVGASAEQALWRDRAVDTSQLQTPYGEDLRLDNLTSTRAWAEVSSGVDSPLQTRARVGVTHTDERAPTLLLDAQLDAHIGENSIAGLQLGRDTEASWLGGLLTVSALRAQADLDLGGGLRLTGATERRIEKLDGPAARRDDLWATEVEVSRRLHPQLDLVGGASWEERASTRLELEYDDYRGWAGIRWAPGS